MTKSEFQKQIQSIPEPIRAKIVNHLAEALCEINAAEFLVTQHAPSSASDFPALSGSLNTSMSMLQNLFDF